MPAAALLLMGWTCAGTVSGDDSRPERPWRALPLVKGGQVAPGWAQVGWGGFAVDGDSLRTECDEKGMGLLLYRKERFGNCQIRVVYRPKDAKSNSGVFVRIDDGILQRLNEKAPAIERDKGGKLSEEITGTAVFLASDDSDAITGQVIPVDAGMIMLG